MAPAGHAGRGALPHLRRRSGGIYVDGTFGAGGYTRACCSKQRIAGSYAIDRDPSAIRAAGRSQGIFGDRLVLLEGRFSRDDRSHGGGSGSSSVDGVLLDIGVSSMQLDDGGARLLLHARRPARHAHVAGHGVSAADVVNTLEEPALKHLLRVLGEERRAHAVVRAIAAARGRAPITRTSELAAIVDKALGRRPGERISPATRTFQALRIYVNGELDELVGGLNASEQLLRPGGRLAVLTFHSLEDRIVKRFLKERCGATGRPSRHSPPVEQQPARFVDILPGGVTATAGEIAANPRARSARLRAAERTTAAATALDRADFDEITQLEAGRGC